MKTPTMEIRDHVSLEERQQCQAAVRLALRDGTLTKPSSCSWCGGDSQPIHGHHPDYNRPLMVVWICGPCHRAHHARYHHELTLFHPKLSPAKHALAARVSKKFTPAR